MPKGKRLKLNIPTGRTLCPKCDGIGCKVCGGKGYYDAHVDSQSLAPPPRPIRVCGTCGSVDWWWREPCRIFDIYSPGAWLCGRCHPKPNREEGKEENDG